MHFYIKILVHNCPVFTTSQMLKIHKFTLLAFSGSIFHFQKEMNLNKAASCGNFKSFNLFFNRGNLECLNDCSIESVYSLPSHTHPVINIFAFFKGGMI